jgi:putative restriction endonuclease
MTRDELLARFDNLVTWQRGGQRAPHKPLLILLALGEWQNGRQAVRFEDAQKPLSDLLQAFGPPRKARHPEFPFWRLQNDNVWEVITSAPVQLGADGGVSQGELLRVEATGQFPVDIRSALTADPAAIDELARRILVTHFPPSYHQDILDAVGLELDEPRAGGGRRDPHFRQVILTAYEHQCAVCGLQLLLSGLPVALEAAHIRWHQAEGPSIVQNGLCLCCLHHKLFDLGAMTLARDLTVTVSDQVAGLSGFHEHLLGHHGRRIKMPIHGSDTPDSDFIEWHHREVFRGSPRPN